MSFDWMSVPGAPARRARQADASTQMYRHETRRLAAMLKRFSYTHERALQRCQENHRWEYTDFGTPPLSDDDIAQIVGRVYGVQAG